MPKRDIAPLEAGRVRLRLLEERDLSQTLAWRNQEHIRRWFFSSDPLTPQQHATWFAKYLERDDDFVFVIETDLRPVGQVALYNIDWTAGRAEFGRLMIGEAEAAGRGLAREATEAILDLAFRQLGLREVYLDVIPENARAIGVYKACGFAVTGSTKKVVSMRKQTAA
jgi:diamine N-acetyltransferase